MIRLTVVTWGVFAGGIPSPLIIDASRTNFDDWTIELPAGRI
jgi:hypothetical protein